MKFYHQTTEFTCATSSLLMILNHFNSNIELTQTNEFKIWRATVILPTRASSIFGLANYAKKQGLNVKILLENTDYKYPEYRFKGYKKIEIETAKIMSKQYLEETKKIKIKINIKSFNLKNIKYFLKKNKILLIRLNAGTLRNTKSNSQYFVLYAYKNNFFSLIDPLTGRLEVDEETLERSIATLKTKKKRGNRIIIFG